MPVRWASPAEFTLGPSLRRFGALLAVALLSSLAATSLAAASPLGQVADTAASAVPPVGWGSAPSLPSTAAPNPPAQAPAQVPVPPVRPPVDLPEVTRHPSAAVPDASPDPGRASGPAAALPPAAQAATGTAGSAGSAGAPTSARSSSAPPPSGPAGSPTIDGGSGPGATAQRRLGTGAIQPATVAPLQRFLAHVWPAVVVSSAGELLATLRAGLGAAISPLAEVPQLLSPQGGDGSTGGVAGLTEQSAPSPPTPSPSDSPVIHISDSGEIALLILLAAGAAVMALLAYTIRREIHTSYRWRI
jgi:hypothetical protein